jgi:putative Ca2+/H+ antiporter (TMEM165/GDT1 family)
MKLSFAPSNLPALEHPQLLVSQQSGEPTPATDRPLFTTSTENAQGMLTGSQQEEQSKDLILPESCPIRERKSGAREVFGSTFLTIFLAEFGDKTQLSTLLMSAESQLPWVVFLGSAAALITTSLLGVLLGRWLATRLAPRTMETAAGVSMLLISVMLLWDIARF